MGRMIHLVHAHKRGKAKRSSLYRALGSGTSPVTCGVAAMPQPDATRDEPSHTTNPPTYSRPEHACDYTHRVDNHKKTAHPKRCTV